jgi:hypothetical protein
MTFYKSCFRNHTELFKSLLDDSRQIIKSSQKASRLIVSNGFFASFKRFGRWRLKSRLLSQSCLAQPLKEIDIQTR